MTTTTQPAIEPTILAEYKPTLTPFEIDTLITNYEHARDVAAGYAAQADVLKRNLIALVELQGFAASKAERSKRLEGALNTVTVTRGTTIIVNEPQVDSFYQLLGKKMGQSAAATLFGRIFATRTKHELVSGAEDVVRTVTLAQRTKQAVLAAFGLCFTISDKAPTIKIKLRTPEKPARKPRAKKGGAQ